MPDVGCVDVGGNVDTTLLRHLPSAEDGNVRPVRKQGGGVTLRCSVPAR